MRLKLCLHFAAAGWRWANCWLKQPAAVETFLVSFRSSSRPICCTIIPHFRHPPRWLQYAKESVLKNPYRLNWFTYELTNCFYQHSSSRWFLLLDQPVSTAIANSRICHERRCERRCCHNNRLYWDQHHVARAKPQLLSVCTAQQHAADFDPSCWLRWWNPRCDTPPARLTRRWFGCEWQHRGGR